MVKRRSKGLKAWCRALRQSSGFLSWVQGMDSWVLGCRADVRWSPHPAIETRVMAIILGTPCIPIVPLLHGRVSS